MLKSLLLTAITFILAGTGAPAQSATDSLFSFYPYEVGNMWQYKYKSTNPSIWQFTYFTVEVTGDTTNAQGLRFMKLLQTGPGHRLMSYVHLDATSGSVYLPAHEDMETIYLIDSIGCSQWVSCVCGHYAEGTMFGQPVLMRSIGCIGGIQTLAQGIGMVERVDDDGRGWENISTLVYARVNGREYGNLVSVEEKTVEEEAMRLAQNSPNPFEERTTITYSIPAPAYVKIGVTTLLGEPVATLVDEIRPAGEGTALFDASGLPGGTYLCTMRSGGRTITQRMVVAR